MAPTSPFPSLLNRPRRAGADPNARSDSGSANRIGWTPIMAAAECGHLPSLAALLPHCPLEALLATDPLGRDAAAIALAEGRLLARCAILTRISLARLARLSLAPSAGAAGQSPAAAPAAPTAPVEKTPAPPNPGYNRGFSRRRACPRP